MQRRARPRCASSPCARGRSDRRQRERTDPVHRRRAQGGQGSRRLHGLPGLRSPLAADVDRQPRDPRGRRPRAGGRLHEAQGGHRPEARAQPDLDCLDDPARQGLRQPDGRRRRRQREATGAGARDRADGHRRRAPTRPTRRSTASEGSAKVAIVSLLTGLDAAEARARLAATGGDIRPALEGARAR